MYALVRIFSVVIGDLKLVLLSFGQLAFVLLDLINNYPWNNFGY